MQSRDTTSQSTVLVTPTPVLRSVQCQGQVTVSPDVAPGGSHHLEATVSTVLHREAIHDGKVLAREPSGGHKHSS